MVKMKQTVFSVFVGLLFGLLHPAWAGISSTVTDGGFQAVVPTGLAVVWGTNDIDVYHSAELVELMASSRFREDFGGAVISRMPGFPAPSFSSRNLAWVLEQAVVITIFFPDPSVVHTLSAEEIDALGTRLRLGNAFVGTQGSLEPLISTLGLPELDDLGEGSDPVGSAVEFSYPMDDGVRDDLFLMFDAPWLSVEPSIGEIWTEVSGWIGDTLGNQGAEEAVSASGLEAPAAWNNSFSQDHKGILDSGTAHLKIIGWKLDTTSSVSDWYLIRTELQSHIKEFKYLWAVAYAELGWYTSEQSIYVQLKDNAKLWDYMPNTAVRNITKGIDFSIGGDLGAKVDGEKFGGSVGVKANVSYKQSYTAPEIALLDGTDKANNRTGVYVEYPLADWRGYPFYVHNPPDVSRTTYNLISMFIAEVPKGAALELSVVPKVNQRKDLSYPCQNSLHIITGHSLVSANNTWTDKIAVKIGGR